MSIFIIYHFAFLLKSNKFTLNINYIQIYYLVTTIGIVDILITYIERRCYYERSLDYITYT